MSRGATNDTKREEMAQLVGKVLGCNVSRTLLALAESVTPGAIGTWARGTSMGTNAQRQELRNFLANAQLPDEVRARVWEQARRVVANREISLAKAEARAKEDPADGYMARVAERCRVRLAEGREVFARGGVAP